MLIKRQKQSPKNFIFLIFQIVKNTLLLFHIFLFIFFNLYLLYKLPKKIFVLPEPIPFIKKIDEMLETLGNESLKKEKERLYQEIKALEEQKITLGKQNNKYQKKLSIKEQKINDLQKKIETQRTEFKQIEKVLSRKTTEADNSQSISMDKYKIKLKELKKQLKVQENTNQYILIMITIALTFICSMILLIYTNKIRIQGYNNQN
ncbi:MAG: hypothetical protein WJU30_00406 [Candidatus Phytoplasma pruni]